MIPNGHAVADQPSRLLKARKIEALLGGNVAGLDVLDLGAGSGLLADYFHSRGANVTAADRSDVAYASTLPLTVIGSDSLPFGDASFDIVIFNHVIEHVGAEVEQRAMLAEIKRILRPGGRLYLAVPNKWALVEPHFKLPLLGALPRPLANLAVRLFRGDPEYDCYPLGHSQLLDLMKGCFPTVRDKSADALAWVVEHELRGFARVFMAAVPASLFRLARSAYPTFIMVAETAATGIARSKQ